MLFYWFLKFVAIGPVVHAVFRPRAEGTENVPAQGCAILASNHLSAADWIFMPLSQRRRVTFLAKAEYFTGKGIKGWAQRVFFAGSGQVPIDRTSGTAAEDAIRTGIRILRDPYSAKPYVLFYTTKRVGGGVQDYAAIKLLKFAA